MQKIVAAVVMMALAATRQRRFLRFERHANGATGVLNQRFVWGLDRTLGLTEEEAKVLLEAYVRALWGPR
jgi:hypothetical protein